MSEATVRKEAYEAFKQKKENGYLDVHFETPDGVKTVTGFVGEKTKKGEAIVDVLNKEPDGTISAYSIPYHRVVYMKQKKLPSHIEVPY